MFVVDRSDYSQSMSEEKGTLLCQAYADLLLDSKSGSESSSEVLHKNEAVGDSRVFTGLGY